MTETTNYHLKKPEGSDFVGPGAFNDNADLIDAALHALEEGKLDKDPVTGKLPESLLPPDPAADKATPADADWVALTDTAAANARKKLTWESIKATLKSYFDGLYAAVNHTHAWSAITGKPSSFAPSAHAATHKTGGADAITPAYIGAAAASHTHAPSDLTSPVPLAKGGTGATTAAAARSNLGAAASVHTHAEYDKTVKATYPVAAGQSITAGDVVDVVDGEVTIQQAPIEIDELAIGTVIQLNENGTPVDYIIVHQGLPSAIYDSSCDGAWVLRKDIFETRPWNNTNVNDWANSTLKAYLDSTFLARFDSTTQASIKQVKIPYRPGSGTSSTINSGANGLSCKIFLLSGYEMGWTSSDNQYLPADGAKLSYFDSGTGTTANNKRIAHLSGGELSWWLRSPNNSSSANAWRVGTDGSCINSSCGGSYGVRPALILDNNFPVNVVVNVSSQAIALTNATAGQDCEVIYSGVASLPGITAGQKITSDGVYGVGVLDGVLQVWSKDRPGTKVITGSYTGTGTGSTSQDVVTLQLPLIPKFISITSATGGISVSGPVSDGKTMIINTGDQVNIAITVQGKTVGIHGTYSDAAQYSLNVSGREYCYTAIG